MVQRRDYARLALEAFGKALGGNFDGDGTAEAGILRAVDLAHSPHAETILNGVRPQFVAR